MARRRSGKKIDFVHWTTASQQFLGQAAGVAAKTLLSAQHEPETLLRMRGEAVGYADGAQAPGGLAAVTLGIIAVPEGTGTTVLWAPFSDGDAPWIWFGFYHVGYEEMVTDVVDVPGMTSFRWPIDNKAMRILRNQEVQVVIENTTLATAVSVNASVAVRILAGT